MRIPCAVVVSLLVLLTGCGSLRPGAGSPSVEELFDRIRASAAAATSGQVTGRMSDADGEFAFEVRGARDGSNQQLLITDAEGSSTILSVDGRHYLKGDEAFWSTEGEDVWAEIGDSWVVMDDPGEDLLTVDTILAEFEDLTPTFGDMVNTKVEDDTVDGIPAYRMTARVKTDEVSIWVDKDGNLLQIQDTAEQAPFLATFTQWNAVPPFTAPPAEEVLDPEQA